MAINYDLNNTGPEVQERLDLVMPNKADILAEQQARQEADAALQGQIDAINEEIGSGEPGSETINGRLDALEEAVGDGGSVDERIAAAKDEVVGDASADYDTLGKIEGVVEGNIEELAEHESRLNALSSQNYVTVTANEFTTAVTDVLPETGSADTVYRVGKWDGEQYDATVYAEYAWYGNAYGLLDVKEYGIDEFPTEGSENVVKSGGIYTAMLDRAIVGPVVGDPQDEWEPGTVEQYVDNRFAAQNAEVDARLEAQDGEINTMKGVIHTLNGNEVVIVADHTAVQNPEAEVIYRQPSTDSYTDWMWDDSLATPAWAEIATYSFPGIDEEPTASSGNLVLSSGVEERIMATESKLGDIDFLFNVTKSGEHSSNLDRFNINIPAGTFNIKLKNVTSQSTGAATIYVHYVGDVSNTVISDGIIIDGAYKQLTAEHDIDNIGFYMSNAGIGTMKGNVTFNIPVVVNVAYAGCATDADVAAKTCDIPDYKLSTNVRLVIRMTNTNTAASPTLNISSTGAKNIYYNGTVASDSNKWAAGEVLDIYFAAGYNAYMATTHVELVQSASGTSVTKVPSQKAVKDALDAQTSDYDAKISSVKSYSLRSYFIGKGANNSFVEVYGLKKGHSYRLSLQESSLLTDTSPDTSLSKFYIGYQKNDESFSNLINVKIGSGNVPDEIGFVIPDDFKVNGIVRVGGRAVANTVINFSVYNLSVYSSIGDSILKPELYASNVFDISTASQNKLINNNGNVVDGDCIVSDYIFCAGKDYISTNYGGRAGVYHAFYDFDKNIIGIVLTTQKGGYEIPEGAYYVRLTLSKYSQKNYAAFVNSTTLDDNDYVAYQTIHGKVESIDSDVVELNKNKGVTYGLARCTTAGDVADKVVTVPDLVTKNNGESQRFVVMMSNATSVQANLQVNGGTARALYYNGVRASSTNTWANGEKLDVTYNANYPGYFATTIPNFKQSVNEVTPSPTNVISEVGLISYVGDISSAKTLLLNKDKVSAIVSTVSRSPLAYEKTNNNLCFAFSVVTDLHSDLNRFKRACEFADSVDEISATLTLGDMIHTSSSENPYPLILNYTKPIIPIPGNHEVMKKSSQSITGWDEAALLSNMYSADLVTHNGETHPTGKCYWYKDFTKTVDSTTKKLRVIGLHQYEGTGTGDQNTGSGKDVTFYSQDQIDWLIDRLDECDSNTYVMLLIHYSPTNNVTRIECPFTPSSSFGFPVSGGSTTGGSSSMSDDEFIPKIIQAWLDGTTLNVSCDITVGSDTTTITAIKNTAFSAHEGKFAGYFCGHTHRDFVGKLTNYPDQLQFAFITSSANTAQNQCDTGRATSGKSQDCFTVVGIDWFKGGVSLIRIGADVTTDMRERKYAYIEIPT